MTLPSRHRVGNSSTGGLRPRTLPLSHNCYGKKELIPTAPATVAWCEISGLFRGHLAHNYGVTFSYRVPLS